VSSRTVVAIDGPAASGKSSTAQTVAERLGYLHVDSGSLYRAATAAALRINPNVASWTEASVLEAARKVSLLPARTSFYPAIDGKSAEEEIRGPGVTKNVSLVAKMPRVRAWVNERVREAATNHDVVVDGRDMGSFVFPEARIKIFLTADAETRARRRLLQRGAATDAQALLLETRAINERDQRDAEQTQPAPDAILIDSTDLSQAEQVDRIVALALHAS
jgi:cytidylate kinase